MQRTNPMRAFHLITKCLVTLLLRSDLHSFPTSRYSVNQTTPRPLYRHQQLCKGRTQCAHSTSSPNASSHFCSDRIYALPLKAAILLTKPRPVRCTGISNYAKDEPNARIPPHHQMPRHTSALARAPARRLSRAE